MSDLVETLSQLLLDKGLKLVTAESCTGGLIASSMTRRAGSSDVFERGFVTYSNEAKMEELGVHSDTLEAHGAVSAQVAEEMAAGALKHSRADIAVSVTGVAGPGGGSDEKPVGLVFFGFAGPNSEVTSLEVHFTGDRHEIQNQAVDKALEELISRL